MWDAAGRERFTVPGRQGPIPCLGFSPDGRTLATTEPGAVRLWDAHTGTPVGSLPTGQGVVHCLAFSRDGETYLTGRSDGSVARLDRAGESPLELFRGHAGAVTGIALGPDGRTLATSSWDGTVILRDAATGADLGSLSVGGRLSCVAFSPDGRTLAAAGESAGERGRRRDLVLADRTG